MGSVIVTQDPDVQQVTHSTQPHHKLSLPWTLNLGSVPIQPWHENVRTALAVRDLQDLMFI